jgi:signal transduction histidine kinase
MDWSERHHATERWEDTAFLALPYAMLVVSLGLVASAGGQSGGALLVDVALAALTALWILWMDTLHPDWRERAAVSGVYVGVLIVLMAVLVWRSPWFAFFAWTGYPISAIRLEGRWMIAGVSGTALVVAASQIGGVELVRGEPGTFAIIAVANAAIASAMIWFARQRRDLFFELADANGRLEAALAENAGLHAQLLAQAREAGVLDERQRMAGEIHDTLAQGLTGIIAQLQAAEQDGAGWRRHVGRAVALARGSLSDARRSVQALRPEPLERARLPEAVRGVAERWSTLHGIPLDVTVTGTPRPLQTEVEVTLLRCAQEALANVAKHAHATRTGLTLSYMEDLVTLDVRDDGTGGATERSPGAQGGFGLTAMRQRVAALTGSLAIESEPGAGTALSVSLPAVPLVSADSSAPALAGAPLP